MPTTRSPTASPPSSPSAPPGDHGLHLPPAATANLPDDLARLAGEASAEGIANVARLIESWADGSQRYDRPGEAMLLGWSADVVVGVGGLARCPDVPGALRVRRFYVSAAMRRRGVATMLAEALIATAFEHVDTISCNAGASAAAPPFWEASGFAPVDRAGITHLRQR